MRGAKLPVFLIDFDHTLFDSSKFLAALAQCAAAQGIKRADFLETFEEVTEQHNDAPYRIADHARLISSRYRFNKNEFVNSCRGIVTASHQFLYGDTIPFLKRVRSWDVSTHLCTFASSGLREDQLRHSGIRDYFDTVTVLPTRAKKIQMLRSTLKQRPQSIVLDDHPQILASLTNAAGLRVRIRRKIVQKYVGREPPLIGVPIFSSLPQVYDFVAPLLRSFGPRDSRSRSINA
jgi:phosphoglycolate phosphatase-like HAD superfamily hydrolase